MRFELYFFKFCNALNELKNLVAEFLLYIPFGNVGILDGVVQKRRRYRRTIHSEVNQNLSYRAGVRKVLLARSPLLVGVRLLGKVKSLG